MKEIITICIVHYNDTDFVLNSLYCLEKLTQNNYKVLILDNGSDIKNYEKLKTGLKKYPNVSLWRKETKMRGSIAHGTALNELVSKVDTPYFSILDADATWLIKNWDEILISQLNEKVKVIGTQAPVGSAKPQDFPLMFTSLFETKSFKEVNVDFRPRDLSKFEDTGHEMREKYLKASFQGKTIEMKNTRTYKNGPFKEVICGEYYLEGYNQIFASHFGRGSSSGQHKYRHDTPLIYQLPIIGKWLRIKRGKREKEKWLKICKKIVDNQI